ncbi:MAG: NAD(P)-dependent oxidoreductase [Planctomycetota bacterium]
MKLGWIGLGIMGAPMAGRLMEAGHTLAVWNRTPAKAQPLLDRGAAWADSPSAVAAGGAEVVFVNVTDTPDVEAVLFGGDAIEAGLAAGAPRGLVVIDHSTINPVATRELARRLHDTCGATLLDAPVSGGDVGAQRGTLSIMVGGPAEAVARVRPLLDVLGQTVTHVGDSGAGQACKACNQVAAVGALLGAVEALALADRLGLDKATMIDVVGAGAGGSWQLSNLGPKVAAGDHEPGFFIDYLLKDLAIAADAARDAELSPTLIPLARALFRSVSDEGGGRLGTQAVARAYERLGGFSFE